MKRRKPLRKMSRKKVKEIKAVGAERAEFLHAFCVCMNCCNRAATDVHEIPRGANRHRAFGDRRGWLALCRPCHDLADSYSKFPLERAYVLKRLHDPEYWDLQWLNEARGKAPSAIDDNDLNGTTPSL
jgi:hypothetical protein